jgi:predicted enzyme related to lactoylglutathione lyase
MTDFKLMGFVLLTEDTAASRFFYEKLLGQEVELDINGVNIAFKGGLTLWQKEYAHNLLFSKKIATPKDKQDLELYFEATDIEEALDRMQKNGVEFLHPLMTQPWLQRCFRVYDPDHFIVEIAESMPDVIKRLHREGLTVDQIVEKSEMPKEVVEAIVQTSNHS